MSELKNWIESRDELKNEIRRTKENLEHEVLKLETNDTNNPLGELLNTLKEYEKILIAKIKTLLPNNKDEYSKDAIEKGLVDLQIDQTEYGKSLMEDIKSILPPEKESYNKRDIEAKLNELSDQNFKNNNGAANAIEEEYNKIVENTRVLCGNMEKYMKGEDDALTILEELLLYIKEKSGCCNGKAKKEAEEIRNKNKTRFVWQSIVSAILIIGGIVAQVFMFTKININDSVDAVSSFGVKNVIIIVGILVILAIQIFLAIWWWKSNKKRKVVCYQLDMLISSMEWRKISQDEIKKTMSTVLEEMVK